MSGVWRLIPLFLLACSGPEPLELQRLGGGTITVGRSSRPQLLHFWSLTCSSCLKELPLLGELKRQHPEIELIAIPVATDPPAQVARFVGRHRFPFPVAFDLQGEAMRRFRVEAVPLWILLDCRGKPLWRHLGTLTEEVLRAELRSLSC